MSRFSVTKKTVVFSLLVCFATLALMVLAGCKAKEEPGDANSTSEPAVADVNTAA